MSKERLKDIVKRVKRSGDYEKKGLWEASDGLIVRLHNEGNINYLIERVQGLEGWQEKAQQMHESMERQDKVIDKFREQNKRYREALEFYAESSIYNCEAGIEQVNEDEYEATIITTGDIFTDFGEKARKALESETNE